MKSSDKRSGSLDLVLKVTSILTIYVVLASYGVNVAFYSGYFASFGIDINLVNYWPSLNDFMIRSVGSLVAIVLGGFIYFLLMSVVRYVMLHIQRIANRQRWSVVAFIADGFAPSRRYIAISAVLATLILTFVVVYSISYKLGSDSAAQQVRFTVLVDADKRTNPDTVIYQSGGVGIVKSYDTPNKRFLDGYRIVDLAGQSFESINLR